MISCMISPVGVTLSLGMGIAFSGYFLISCMALRTSMPSSTSHCKTYIEQNKCKVWSILDWLHSFLFTSLRTTQVAQKLGHTTWTLSFLWLPMFLIICLLSQFTDQSLQLGKVCPLDTQKLTCCHIIPLEFAIYCCSHWHCSQQHRRSLRQCCSLQLAFVPS